MALHQELKKHLRPATTSGHRLQHPYKYGRSGRSSLSILMLTKYLFIFSATTSFQTLSFHYMTPMAGRISNQYNFIFSFLLFASSHPWTSLQDYVHICSRYGLLINKLVGVFVVSCFWYNINKTAKMSIKAAGGCFKYYAINRVIIFSYLH